MGTTLERARQGDRQALDALLADEEGRVWRFAARMCRDREDAREVQQETMLSLARGVAAVRDEGALPSWLFTVARRACMKARRRRKHAPEVWEELPEEVEGHEADPAAQASQNELGRALERALAGLEPPLREVLLLRDVEGLTADEVAGVLSLGVPAVKSRLHRARLRIREELAPHFGPPPAPAAPGCPDVLALFTRHVEGDIDAATCKRMEDHLASCPRCSATCDTLKKSLALCRTTPVGVVPPDVQASVRSALRLALSLRPTNS